MDKPKFKIGDNIVIKCRNLDNLHGIITSIEEIKNRVDDGPHFSYVVSVNYGIAENHLILDDFYK